MDFDTAFDLVALGETMVMVTPNDATPLLDADQVQLSIGGAESNVAAHVAALGHRSAWISAVGDDVLGRRVQRAISAHGVDTRWVRVNAHAPTGVYFKDPGRGVLYYRAGSAASNLSSKDIDWDALGAPKIVHISGITPALSPSCAELIDAVLTRIGPSETLVSFDVNYRAALWPVATAAPVLRELANRADLVFVGRDEAETLWQTETPDDVRALLAEPAHLVVKDGDVGATEFSSTGAVFEPAIKTAVVEPVGAGDAFAAGYLSGLLANEGTGERLRRGHQQAHLVLQSTHDVPSRSTQGAAPSATRQAEGATGTGTLPTL